MATAIREVEEETGVGLTEKDLVLIGKKDESSHDRYFYVSEVVSLTGIKARGKKNEEVRVFLPHEVLALQDFFRNHRNVFSRYLLALVVGLDEYLAVVHPPKQGR
jgi:8-oxo-dGTP pyrophosphatase MutT (NUDIX family)